ncbi:TVP38/TMEM64 family protein [Granulosicoccus antarcticus]|uniref:TVP38/TMEM64 family membrane protein n=1 Tax=Granulosicoccus antarcticus IMCC3135 TaxID=1192854 RepID=A0A2Z2NHP7_9GAMM|nr:VTT domain-containing protein [Granulosicoccus antarcticus]ASJ70812.1 hypothetical protein IMCC3135_03495 [Granulosicoccus antarcticus IMCC3135]
MGNSDVATATVATQPSVLWSILRGVGKLLFLVLILWFLHEMMPASDTLMAAWQRWLAGDPTSTLLLFIGGGILFVALGLPRQTLALLGGYVYGTLSGCLLALLVTLAGSVLTYAVARRLGRPLLQRRFPAQIAKFDDWTADHVFAKTLALRLFPVGSNLATNIAAGVSHAPPRPFFLASLLGFVPQTAVFALSGTAVGDSSLFHMLMAIALLIVSIVTGGYVVNVWRHRNS